MAASCDILVVGAGMAGASVAYELAADRQVVVLEVEEHPGYHATGRSAAAYIPSYGFENPALRALTLASRGMLEAPDPAFRETGFLFPRGLISVAAPDGQEQLRASYQSKAAALDGVEWVDEAYLRSTIPILRDEYLQGAILERDVFDIDVHGLHESYLKGLKRRGGVCATASPVLSVSHSAGHWTVTTPSDSYTAPILVDAAGAWADVVAGMAGVAQIGLQPLRRTAILLDVPAETDRWPLVVEADIGFYFKPDAGRLLVSPADESESAPCDAAPEEIDIACAAHYAEQALDINIRQVRHAWAGLRSFVADRTPVIGFDGHAEGFFWMAGQGGHGIQTAPAAAQLAAALITGGALPEVLRETPFDPVWVAPTRLSGGERAPT